MKKFKKPLQKRYFFTAVPIALILFLSVLVVMNASLGSAGLVYFGIGCLALYLTSIISFILVLTPGKNIFGEHTEEIGAILLATILPALIIAVFAMGWKTFPQFHNNNLPTDNFTDLGIDFTNSVYMSAVTFTSTGYGDFVPTNWAGRWYALIEAFIGHVHAVVFFSLLFSRVERWRSKQEAKVTAATSLRTRRKQRIQRS
jgi:hypothetical protein